MKSRPESETDPTGKISVDEKLEYEARLRKLSNAIHSASTINEILVGLRKQILTLYKSQFVTIYLYDPEKKQVYSRVRTRDKKIKEIRVAVNTTSVAGFVAATRKVVNVRNVYDKYELMGIDPDLKFDSSWDVKTGFITRQVLAVPITFNDNLMGVIQLINRQKGAAFTPEDQTLLSDISEILGIAFHNQLKRSKKTPSKYDALINNGILSEKDLETALGTARKKRLHLEEVLITSFGVQRSDVRQALSLYYKVPAEDVNNSRFNPEALVMGKNITYFEKARWLPLSKDNDKIIVALDDPNDVSRIQEIKQMFSITNVEMRVCLKSDIDTFIQSYKSAPTLVEGETITKSLDEILSTMKVQEGDIISEKEQEEEVENVNDNSVVLLVRKIIEDAYVAGASDIHIEPYGKDRDSEVRFRVDGRCIEMLTIPKNFIKGVVSRIKILSKLDIAERRKPQDGKIRFKTTGGKDIELRVATVPTANSNEDVVMRLLASSEPLPIKKVMPEHTFKRFERVITQPYGIVLVVGPTGSGKTTTLHSALGYINTPERKIWTAEDPVEITQYRLRQVQVRPKIGFTFAAAMRAFLRADPDVIMVGEMRDEETMSIGVEASLTGHLVFSTLHTNSAPETITRLNDMGLDPFNFADTLLGILAQRLVKTLCSNCKESYHPDEKEYDRLTDLYGPGFKDRIGISYTDELKLFKATGCEKCGNTGYKGRMGLYEFLEGSDAIKNLIIKRAMVDEIRETAIKEGMLTLLQDGVRNVFEGNTDIHQVLSVCSR